MEQVRCSATAHPEHTSTTFENTYFGFQAAIGMTKHLGGAFVSDELAALCHLTPGQRLLDVGCGVGLTTCQLAEGYGITAVGVDLRPAMVERAREYAKDAGIANRIEFRAADAQMLPFAADTFDVVMCESVLVFVDDQAKALREFVRVTKPGGYVGFTEAIWAREPSEALKLFLSQNTGREFDLKESWVWEQLLTDSGLIDPVVRVYKDFTLMKDAKNQIRRVGWSKLLKAYGRAINLLIREPKYRAFMREATKLPGEIAHKISYGLYVGRKPAIG